MKHLKGKGNAYDVEVAWDIEATNWSDIVLVVGVGSDGGEVVARGIPDFERQCRARGWLNHKTRFWAHWGGIYDNHLLLEWALPRWRVDSGSYMPGGGLWSVDLCRARERWVLRDSARLMTDSLARVGKAFGLEKIEVDRTRLETLSDEELVRYCKRDAEIVLLALQRFAAVWNDFGADLRETIASTAATYLRKEAIPEDAWGWTAAQDSAVEGAYYGGRVERFVKECGPAYYFDINSSYPHEMGKPLPTRLTDTGFGAPPKRAGTTNIVRAKVDVPVHTAIGPLPFRPTDGALKDRLVFPVGQWTALYCQDELDAAEDCGATYEPLQYWQYETAPWLAPYMAHWYAVKRDTTDPAMRYIAKLAMNAVSGKLIQRGEYEDLTQSTRKVLRAVERAEDMERNAAEANLPMPARRGWQKYTARTRFGVVDIHGVSDEVPGPMRHAAAAAVVLGNARANLLRAMVKARNHGAGHVYYCDTDSIVMDGEIPTGTELGEWKRECTLTRGEFLAPKVYALWETDADGPQVRAKGFRLKSTGMTQGEFWDKLRAGEPIEFDSSRGFKSGLRFGDIRYTRVKMSRQLHIGIDKRCFDGNTSRPWHTEELDELESV